MTNASNAPHVLIVTEDILAPSHGTGTTLMRHFRHYDQRKLLNLYYNPVTSDGAFMQSIRVEYPPEAWTRWHESGNTQWDVFVPMHSIREQIEQIGFKPDVVYSTYFGIFGYMLTQRLLEEYHFQLPVIQHFHDLMMPHDDLEPLYEALRSGVKHYDEMWALTNSIATDIEKHTGRQLEVVNTFCDTPPPVTKQAHRAFGSNFKAVITGNIWLEETIVDLKAAWKALQRENPTLQPIQWYCHPDRMRENLERYVYSDDASPITYGGFLNRDALYATLADADMAIIPFNRSRYPENNYAKYSLPSRLTETVLAGVPVFALAGSETETAHYIKQHGIGVTSNPTLKSSFRKDMWNFVNDREQREQMGKNAAILARQYDLTRYQDFFFTKLRDVAQKPRKEGVAIHSGTQQAPFNDGRKVSILICTPNADSELTQRCIRSIRKYTTRIPYEILLFENGNYGEFNHAREMNRALEIAQGDVFVSLDDDVEVTGGWLEALLELAEPDVGIVGCVHWHGRDRAGRMDNPHRNISHAGGTLKAEDGTAVHYTHVIEQPTTAPYACSACILINDMSLRFDSSYRKYYHDVDISLESWHRGKKVVISSHPIYHYVNGQMRQMGHSQQDVFDATAVDLQTFYDKWIATGKLADLERQVSGQLDVPLMHNNLEFLKLVELESNGGESQPASVLGYIEDIDDDVSAQQVAEYKMAQENSNSRYSSKMYRAYLESQSGYRQWDNLRTRQDRVTEEHRLLSRLPLFAKVYRLVARIYKLGQVWAFTDVYFRQQQRFFSHSVSFSQSTAQTLERLQHELNEAKETTSQAAADVQTLRQEVSRLKGQQESELETAE